MKIQVLNTQGLIKPKRSTSGAAGYDIYSAESQAIFPNERYAFKTNLFLKIPEGYYGRICPRSGLAVKSGIDVLAGVIDSDYIGEIKVVLINLGQYPEKINVGDKIAQIIFQKYEIVSFEEVDDLSKTDRGDNGFGSTGR